MIKQTHACTSTFPNHCRKDGECRFMDVVISTVARLGTPVPFLVPSRLVCHCCVMTPSNAGHTAAKMIAPDTAMKMFSLSHRPRQSPSATASASRGRRARAIAGTCLDWPGTCTLRRLLSSCGTKLRCFLPLDSVLLSEE